MGARRVDGKSMNRREFLLLGAGAAAGISLLTPGEAAARPRSGPPGRRAVRTGLEVLLERRRELLAGKRVGLIANPTSMLPDLTHAVDALDAAVDLTAIFAPEHGFRGEAQAGDSGGDYTDPRTGIPVYDIYGRDWDEIAATFERAGVETVLFDIQDAGARFYTYIWTMSDSLEAAAVSGREYVVLDRPNPISGREAEGPVLDPEYSTFVGRLPIAQVHGMTVGELARMFNAEFVPDRAGGERADLTVVEMQGWRRGMYLEETGQPWVMPSPNMPTPDTAVVYPGTGMFEGTNLSEGRGTTRPFELLGAPYVDWRLADRLNGLGLPGAAFREAYFSPTFSKYRGETVGGIQLYVTDREAFDPIRTALAIFVSVKKLYPGDFEWRYDAWDRQRPYWIDKLTGSDYVRTAVDAGRSPDEIVAGWQVELEEFRRVRRRYLIYHLR
jgi:uncharacterized protein YbbC (DUF1343 family)